MERGFTGSQSHIGLGGGRHRSRSRAPASRNAAGDQMRRGNNVAHEFAAGNLVSRGKNVAQVPAVVGSSNDSRPTGMGVAGPSHGQAPITAVGTLAPATRSWANVAMAAMQGYSLTYIDPSSSGDNIIHCSEEDLNAADPIWNECLVGYFVGKKLPFKLVESALNHLWGQRLLEVKANDQGFYFFRISDSDFRRKVVEGGPLTVARVPLILQQWHPMLDLKKGDHSTIPVWIRLKNLPYGLWSSKGISKVASAVGRPLYVDHRTEQLKMISFARVCVELAATKTCCDTITVDLNGQTRIVDVEYEWKPVSCHLCGTFGHRCPAQDPCPAQTEPAIHARVQPSDLPAGRDEQGHATLQDKEACPAPTLEWRLVNSKKNRRAGSNKQPALDPAPSFCFDSVDDLDEETEATDALEAVDTAQELLAAVSSSPGPAGVGLIHSGQEICPGAGSIESGAGASSTSAAGADVIQEPGAATDSSIRETVVAVNGSKLAAAAAALPSRLAGVAAFPSANEAAVPSLAGAAVGSAESADAVMASPRPARVVAVHAGLDKVAAAAVGVTPVSAGDGPPGQEAGLGAALPGSVIAASSAMTLPVDINSGQKLIPGSPETDLLDLQLTEVRIELDSGLGPSPITPCVKAKSLQSNKPSPSSGTASVKKKPAATKRRSKRR